MDIGMTYNRTASASELALKYHISRGRVYIIVSKLRKLGANIAISARGPARPWKQIVTRINSAFPMVKKSHKASYYEKKLRESNNQPDVKIKKFRLWR